MPRLSLLTRAQSLTIIGTLLVANACGEIALPNDAIAPTPSRLSPSGVSFDVESLRADSLAKGYFGPRRPDPIGVSPFGGPVSVVSVTPGWLQGAAQPNWIFAQLAGPVKSVTLTSGASGDAILCSGDYGRLVAYDAANNLIGDVPFTLINPSDCGADQVTFGAQATVTSSSAAIASINVIPMSPVTFPVNGVPGGRATATYMPQLIADPDPNDPPVARFSAVCVAATHACSFDASASTDDHGVVSYHWDLGAGIAGKLTGKVVSFTYPNANTRMIALTVTDASGRSGTSSQAFYFSFAPNPPGGNVPPNPAFQATCTGLTCVFDSSASTDNGVIVGRAWNFGDGTGSGGNESVVRHTYSAAGLYNASLFVDDDNGAGTQTAKTVAVGSTVVDTPPTANLVYSCGPGLHQCTFDASSSTDDFGIVSYQWSWGNQRVETRTGAIAKNTWAASGYYLVSLTVVDKKGQANSIRYVVLVP